MGENMKGAYEKNTPDHQTGSGCLYSPQGTQRNEPNDLIQVLLNFGTQNQLDIRGRIVIDQVVELGPSFTVSGA